MPTLRQSGVPSAGTQCSLQDSHHLGASMPNGVRRKPEQDGAVRKLQVVLAVQVTPPSLDLSVCAAVDLHPGGVVDPLRVDVAPSALAVQSDRLQ